MKSRDGDCISQPRVRGTVQMAQKKHKFLWTDEKTGDKFILVSEFPVTRYKSGLRAGDQVRLKSVLIPCKNSRQNFDVVRSNLKNNVTQRVGIPL